MKMGRARFTRSHRLPKYVESLKRCSGRNGVDQDEALALAG